MKSFMKKGITLIELVVVIIILILLAVIAIWNTRPTTQKGETALILSEFKSVYEAVNTMRSLYNAGEELVEGQDYCEKKQYGDETWYVVYGLQDYSGDPAANKYNENVVKKNISVDELKRSYEFKLNESYESNKDDVEVRYYNGRYVDIDGYRIRTYTDVQNIKK